AAKLVDHLAKAKVVDQALEIRLKAAFTGNLDAAAEHRIGARLVPRLVDLDLNIEDVDREVQLNGLLTEVELDAREGERKSIKRGDNLAAFNRALHIDELIVLKAVDDEGELDLIVVAVGIIAPDVRDDLDGAAVDGLLDDRV